MEIKRLTELLNEKKYAQIKEMLSEMNSIDLADLLEQFPDDSMVVLFRLISKETAAEVFANMPNDMQQTLISTFTEKELKEIFEDMYMDDTVDILEEMPANVVEQILNVTDKETRSRINELLRYPQDSAGSIMTVEYVDLKKTMTVRQALDKIKKVGIDQETIYTCYVIENKKLLGIVTAKSLMLSDEDTLIETLMETHIISVNTHMDKEEVSKLFHKYHLIAIPVVDTENCMVGIVTFDDAMEVYEDEMNEDISLMAAVQPSDDSYFETSVFNHAKHRILWLLVLMLSATITGTILSSYEKMIASVPLLVSFIPMLMDTGGNCGTQSSTLVIRGIATDEIQFRDLFRVAFKEAQVSLLVGLALAVVNGIRILLMYQDPMLALLLGITLMATVFMAELIGCVLPLLAKKVHLDPAIMAAPLITTIVDTFSIMIYFGVATMQKGLKAGNWSPVFFFASGRRSS